MISRGGGGGKMIGGKMIQGGKMIEGQNDTGHGQIV